MAPVCLRFMVLSALCTFPINTHSLSLDLMCGLLLWFGIYYLLQSIFISTVITFNVLSSNIFRHFFPQCLKFLFSHQLLQTVSKPATKVSQNQLAKTRRSFYPLKNLILTIFIVSKNSDRLAHFEVHFLVTAGIGLHASVFRGNKQKICFSSCL